MLAETCDSNERPAPATHMQADAILGGKNLSHLPKISADEDAAQPLQPVNSETSPASQPSAPSFSSRIYFDFFASISKTYTSCLSAPELSKVS